jgi:hypothetical protein
VGPDTRAPRFGAYGLRLQPDGVPGSLVGAPLGWPTVTVDRRVGTVVPGANRIDDGIARFHFAGGGGLVVLADEHRATFTTPGQMTDEELVHPYLAPVAASFAWWARHECFHAGAVAIDGRVWGVVGEKEAGKSTMLAGLALAGHEVLCDDMLVIADGTAFAGPRCVDLREPAARRLGVGDLTLRPPEPRWRLALPPIEATWPMGGWVFLSWGDEMDVAPISAPALLPRLGANRSMFVVPRDPATLLDLAALPAWELRRPRDWSALPAVVERLAELACR